MEKPLYEVYVTRDSGPDDFEWDLYETHTQYGLATMQVAELRSKGHMVRLFDPYVGKSYDHNGNEV